MSELLTSTALILHLAALLQVAGFLMRDQIKLRVLLLGGSILYSLYYVLHPATPMWEAMMWSSVMAVANSILIVVLVRERRIGRMSAMDREIHRQLGSPLPGHFRRIRGLARIVATDRPVTLTEEGKRPGKLYFVHRGPVRVELPRGPLFLRSPSFVGEIALVLDKPASATTTLPDGGEYLEWDRADVEALFRRHDRVRQSFERLLSHDMARKLGRHADAQEVATQPDADR